jgi:hypothetical protein
MLRSYFQRHRRLLKQLCALAHESLAEYLRTALDCPKGVPGVIMTLHTFGEYLHFHPHIHALVADGLFTRKASATMPGGRPTGDHRFSSITGCAAQTIGGTLSRQSHQPPGDGKVTPA